MLSPRRFTIRQQATAITRLGPTTGVIPRCRSVSDSGSVIMAATTVVATTVAVAAVGTDNARLARLSNPPNAVVRLSCRRGTLSVKRASSRHERATLTGGVAKQHARVGALLLQLGAHSLALIGAGISTLPVLFSPVGQIVIPGGAGSPGGF